MNAANANRGAGGESRGKSFVDDRLFSIVDDLTKVRTRIQLFSTRFFFKSDYRDCTVRDTIRISN